MRVLGIDLGMKRTGVALSDALGITVRGLETFAPRSRAQDIEHLLALAAEHDVEHVVVGLPTLPRSGDDTPWTKRVRGFAHALSLAFDDDACTKGTGSVSVTLLDEARTSIEGARRLVVAGVKKKKRKSELDAAAAAVLVEDFIAQVASGAISVDGATDEPS